MSKTILFLYGTLRTGQRNHRLMSNSRFICKVKTLPHYRLYDLGDYPGMVRDEQNGLAVRGEMWEVDATTLMMLDALEDVDDGLYERVLVEIDHAAVGVESYLYLPPIPADAASGAEWEASGGLRNEE